MSCCFTESQETLLIWCCLSVRACWSTENDVLGLIWEMESNMYELIFITGFQKVVTAVISWKWILWRATLAGCHLCVFCRAFIIFVSFPVKMQEWIETGFESSCGCMRHCIKTSKQTPNSREWNKNVTFKTAKWIKWSHRTPPTVIRSFYWLPSLKIKW